MNRKEYLKKYMKEYNKKYYLLHKEEMIACNRHWAERYPRKVKKIKRKHYLLHREKIRKRTALWKKEHPERAKTTTKEHFKKYPWIGTHNSVSSRCSKKGLYYKRGIKNKITRTELKELWFRDKAYEMRRPSIDRKDSRKDYAFDNCRYIELSENSRQGGLKRKVKTMQLLRR